MAKAKCWPEKQSLLCHAVFTRKKLFHTKSFFFHSSTSSRHKNNKKTKTLRSNPKEYFNSMAGRRRNVNIGANSIVYSGRGRPRKEAAVTTSASSNTNNHGYDRPLPVGIVLGSPSSPAMADLYKNRKIRVGGPFQARVPKYIPTGTNTSNGNDHSPEDGAESGPYTSSRPAPFRVSQTHPHLTEDEVKDHEQTMVEDRRQRTEASIQQLAAVTEGKKTVDGMNRIEASCRMGDDGQEETQVLVNAERLSGLIQIGRSLWKSRAGSVQSC